MIAYARQVGGRCAAFGVVLIALLAALLLPASAAYAGPTAYDVWVGGVQVTSDNASDVLGDGTVEFYISSDGNSAALYLDGATIPYAEPGRQYSGEWSDLAAIYAFGIDLDIILESDSAIVSPETPFDDSYYLNGISVLDGDLAFYAYGDYTLALDVRPCASRDYEGTYGLYVIGDVYVGYGATLDISIENTYEVYGIDCEELEINGGAVRIATSDCAQGNYGIDTTDGVSIQDGTAIITTGDSSANGCLGIYCDDGSFTASGDSIIVIECGNGESTVALYAARALIKESSAIKAIAGDGTYYSYGIDADVITLQDAAVVQAFGTTRALSADPDLGDYALSGALVNAEANPDPGAASRRGGLDPLGGPESVFKFVRIPGPGKIIRLAGDTANETAAIISSDFGSSEYVVLAREDDFADALGATGLAGALHCPIILTDRMELSEAAAAEITRLGATKCYIIGGEGAMKPQLETDLKAKTKVTEITRLWGENSYDTSLACAKEIETLEGGDTHSAVIAMSTNFQDALSFSPIAYQFRLPVILQTWGDTSADRGFTDEAAAWLEGKSLTVVGGPGAISDASVEGYHVYKRIYGETGYDTSNEIALWAVQEGYLRPGFVVIACGAQAPKGVDALAGSALAGRVRAPILLVNGNEAMEAADLTTINGFLGTYGFTTRMTAVLGGTYVVPEDLFELIRSAVGAEVVTIAEG